MRRKNNKRSVTTKSRLNKTSTSESIAPVSVDQSASNLYFDTNNVENRGRFRRQLNVYNLPSTELAINTTDRRKLVNLSRKLFATMGDLTAASKAKASWVVTGGFDLIYDGADKDWSKNVALPFAKKWFANCTNKGLSKDFHSCLKLLSRYLDVSGDVGMQFVQTKNGWPLLNFVEGVNITQRDYGDSEIETGKYAGYMVRDGVVYSNTGRPVAYCLLGKDETDDQIVSATQFQLIMDADFFPMDRGLPVVAAGLNDGYNLREILFYVGQVIKFAATVQSVATNELGRPQGNTISFNKLPNARGGNSNVNTTAPNKPLGRPGADNYPLEEVIDGTRYLRANHGEKLEPFLSPRPEMEVQAHIKEIKKSLMQALGWPHELTLSPGDAGGAAIRGIGEMVRKTILERQLVLAKFGMVAWIYALSTAIENGIIEGPKDSQEDFTNWRFTKGPLFTLDAGYQREANRQDYLLGLLSSDDITRMNGKSSEQVGLELATEADALITRAKKLQEKHPELDLQYCIQFLRQTTPNPVAPIVDNNQTPGGDDDSSSKGKEKVITKPKP